MPDFDYLAIDTRGNETRGHVAADSVDAALKVVLALEDASGLLASRAGVGHVRQDLTERPLKFWSAYSYLVVYDPLLAIC